MSENRGKKLAIGISVSFIIICIAISWWLYHSLQPKPGPQTSLRFVGVGLKMIRDEDSREFVITRVFPGSPAEKAGIPKGFVLKRVDGHEAKTNTIGKLSKLLMGPEGTTVHLIFADTNGDTTNIDIVREPFLNRSKPLDTGPSDQNQ